jgi:transposase-like protein
MGKQRQVENEAFWRAHAQAWAQSGQTVTAYIDAHGLCRSTFSRWRRRLSSAAVVTAPAEPALRLARVRVAPAKPSAPVHCRVALPNGVGIEWPLEAEADQLGAIIAAARQWD